MEFFTATFGFPETDYQTTREKLLHLAKFESVPAASYYREKCDFDFNINGTTSTISAGIFSMPSVAELEKEVEKKLSDLKLHLPTKGSIDVKNMVGEARELHHKFPDSIIQAASQFNMLEFASPEVTPELGISGYIYDATQGPSCAIACAAGTAYRNYLVPVPVQDNENATLRGQRRKVQLDGMMDLESYLRKEYASHFNIPPWKISNGYIESSSARIRPLNELLATKENLQDRLESLLRVGVQEDTTVTDVTTWDVRCTQVYSSAIAVGYSRMPTHLWEPLARLVLNATYKATLLLGILKNLEGLEKGGSTAKPIPILLTMVGGGVFRNRQEWIMEAISKALSYASKYNVTLEVLIVHFRSIDRQYSSLETGNSNDEEL